MCAVIAGKLKGLICNGVGKPFWWVLLSQKTCDPWLFDDLMTDLYRHAVQRNGREQQYD